MLIGWLVWNISDPHCQCDFVENIRCVVSLIVPESCGVRIYCLSIAFETVASEQLHLNPTGVPMIMLHSMYSIRVLQNVEFAGKLSGTVPFPWQRCLKSTSYKSNDIFCKWSWSLIEKRVSTEIGVAVSSFCFLGPWGTLESCDAMESQWRGLCCDHFVVCRSSLLELEICRSRSAFGAQHCEYGVMVHVMKFVSEIM